jgi:hypothetical protein
MKKTFISSFPLNSILNENGPENIVVYSYFQVNIEKALVAKGVISPSEKVLEDALKPETRQEEEKEREILEKEVTTVL